MLCYFQICLRRLDLHSPSGLYFPDTIHLMLPLMRHDSGASSKHISTANSLFLGLSASSWSNSSGVLGTSTAQNPIFSRMPQYLLSGFLRIRQGQRPLFPFDPVRNVEAFYIELDTGVRHESLPHVAGVEEYVFLVHGTLKMVIGGKKVKEET